MKSTLNERVKRAWFGLVASVIVGALSLSGCNQPGSKATVAPTPGVANTSGQTGGTTTGADTKAGGNREGNSRPLNPDKFGKPK